MRKFKMVRRGLRGMGDVLQIVGEDARPSETTVEIIERAPAASSNQETVEINETPTLEVSGGEMEKVQELAKTPTVVITASQIADSFSKETIESIIEKTGANIENIANTALLIFEGVFQAEFKTKFELVGSALSKQDAYSAIFNVESLINSEMLINQYAREGLSVSDSMYMLRLNSDFEEVSLEGGKVYAVPLSDDNIEYIDLDSSNAFSVTAQAMADSIMLATGITLAGNEYLEDLLNQYNPSAAEEKSIYILGGSTFSILKPTTSGQNIISQIIDKCAEKFSDVIGNTATLTGLLNKLGEVVGLRKSADDFAYAKIDAFVEIDNDLLPQDLEALDIVVTYSGSAEEVSALATDLADMVKESLKASLKNCLESSLQLDMVDIGTRLVTFADAVTEFNKSLNGVVVMYLLEDDRLKMSVGTILEVVEDITESYPEIFVRFDSINEYFSAVAQLMSNPSEFIQAAYTEAWYYKPISQLVQSKFDEATAFKYLNPASSERVTEEAVYNVINKVDPYLVDSLLLALGDGFNQSIEFVSSQCDRIASNIKVLCDETQIILDILKGMSKVDASNIERLQTDRDNVLEISASIKDSFKSLVQLSYNTSESFDKLNKVFNTGIVTTARPGTKSDAELAFELSPITKGVIGLSAIALLYAGARKIMK